MAPAVGDIHPISYTELRAWLPTDAACLEELERLRWPDGFCCPRCGVAKGRRLTDGRWWCGECARRVSVTAGTIFHATRTPLTVWLAAAWQMTSREHGVSALELKRTLPIGSEQTAWTMLHRYRTVMASIDHEPLSGTVDSADTSLGAPTPGRHVRSALGITAIRVDVERHGRGLGRCRLQVIAAAAPPSAGELPMSVRKVVSLARRWLLDTHQAVPKPGHLQAYLDEFAFRFNYRHATAPMRLHLLLEHAVRTSPRSYRSFVVDPGFGPRSPSSPPSNKRVRTAELAGDKALEQT
jgi:ribosomal protein L37AE/L43A